MGLVSHDHVWVLPAYYSPNWWRATNASASDSNCTVAMMKNILESVIFIDTVKIPPVVCMYLQEVGCNIYALSRTVEISRNNMYFVQRVASC